ncbi:MAG: lytic transglycosylase domain-containing protein [Ruminococcus sp.]
MSVNRGHKFDSGKIRKYNRATNQNNTSQHRKNAPHKRAKKHSLLGRLVVFILVVAVAGGVIFGAVHLFSQGYIHDKVDDIKKLQYPKKYSEFVEKYSENYGVDENLVYAVIRTESHFSAEDVSGAGAMGLMQITSECFEFLQNNIPDDSTEYDDSALYDPEVNIKFGTYFLSYLLDKYKNIEKTALAAYNAGFGTVDTWLSDPACSEDGENLDVILYPETENYVKKVEESKNAYIDLYG